MRVGDDCRTTASARHIATVVDPGILQQLNLLVCFKLTKYEEGEHKFRCDRTFLHICRVCCEVVEDTNYLIAFSNPGFFFKKLPATILRDFFYDKISL